MPAGLISIDIEARLAKLEEGVTRANRNLEGFGKTVDRVAARARSAFTAFAVGFASAFSALTLTNLIRDTINAAEHLANLSKATGIAVEKLGGIGFAASQSGSNLDDAAKAIGKLQQKIAAANAGNEEAISSFGKLGITLNDLKTKSTDQLFAKLADAFAGTDDGANKAAGGLFFFGKAYQGIIPLLDAGGKKLLDNTSYFEKYGGVTKETAEQAVQFNETMAKLTLLSGSFGRTLTVELLPSLQALASHMVEAKEKSNAFKTVAEETAEVIKNLAVLALYSVTAFTALGKTLGGLAAVISLGLTGNFNQAKTAFAELLSDNEKRLKSYEKLRDAILNPPASKTAAGSPNAPKTPFPSFGAAGGDDAARRILDARIKAFEAAIQSEQDVLRDREHFLQTYYQDDLLGISEYYAKRQEVIRDALANEIAAYEGIVAALEERKAKADEKERVDIEIRIADAVAKRARLEQQAAIRGIDLSIEQTKAAEAFRRKLEEVSLQLVQLSGDQVTAAGFGFDLQNEQLLKRIALERQSSDEQIRSNAAVFDAKMQQLKAVTIAQAEFNQTTTAYGFVLDSIGNAQARVNIAVTSGQLTELEGLSRLSAVNAARLADLQKLVDAATESAQRLAEIFGVASPIAQAAFRDVDNLRLKMEELAATGDLVARKFNEIGSSSFSQFLKDLAGGRSLLTAIQDLGKTLQAKITDVVADSLAQKAFGKGGIFSGFGDLFGTLFGGGKDAAGAAALTAAGSTLTASGTVLTAAGTSLAASAAALSASAAALAASGATSSAGSLFGGIFGAGTGIGEFAAGGSPPVGVPSLVGERGPELFIPRQSGTIVPHHRLGRIGGDSITVNLYPPQNINTQTARQMAKQAADFTTTQRRRG